MLYHETKPYWSFICQHFVHYCAVLFYCSNDTEGTVLASAAHAGKDLIVAHLLSIGVSADGGYDRFPLKVYSKN